MSLVFVLIASNALAAKPAKTLVCHVGNALGSNDETYQQNPDCTIPSDWPGDSSDYKCPDAGKVDLISVSKKAKHLGNPSHSYEDDTGYLWEDYEPEEGIGDDPADFEEGDVVGIDRGCELEEHLRSSRSLHGANKPAYSATLRPRIAIHWHTKGLVLNQVLCVSSVANV